MHSYGQPLIQSSSRLAAMAKAELGVTHYKSNMLHNNITLVVTK